VIDRMKIYSLVTLTILSLTISGCASKRMEVKKVSYAMSKGRVQPNAMNPVIYGYLFERGTKYPAIVPVVAIGKKIISYADQFGRYSFRVEPGKYKFIGKGLGYHSTQTKKVEVNTGDSVRIDFYLKVKETLLVEQAQNRVE
jgi:hypothetical protein